MASSSIPFLIFCRQRMVMGGRTMSCGYRSAAPLEDRKTGTIGVKSGRRMRFAMRGIAVSDAGSHLSLPGLPSSLQRAHGHAFNHRELSTDIVLLAVVLRLRYKLSLRDVAELLLDRGFSVTHEAVWEWGNPHCSAPHGAPAIARLLLAEGAALPL
jgi:hypothetical protein